MFVPNTVPAMDLSHGFQLAIADDAANQLLASLWSAKGLDKTLMLKTGPYGDVGKLFDSVELQAAVPPFVDATAGRLELTIGDLMATSPEGKRLLELLGTFVRAAGTEIPAAALDLRPPVAAVGRMRGTSPISANFAWRRNSRSFNATSESYMAINRLNSIPGRPSRNPSRTMYM